MNAPSPLLELKHVSASIQHRPLFDNLELSVSAGEIVHIAGENGSGKSTLLRLMTGLSHCDHGDICWVNQSIHNNADFSQSCCFIGHKNGLNPDFTVSETIDFYGLLLNDSDNDIDSILLSLSLLELAEIPVKQLSFGQQRRLALARLLISQRQLWILDEPYTGIDDAGRSILNTLCLQHVQSGGIVILTHHGDLTKDFGQHIQRLVL